LDHRRKLSFGLVAVAVQKHRGYTQGTSAAWLQSQRREYLRLFGVDLTQVDGIGVGTLQTLATEVGPDLSRFRERRQKRLTGEAAEMGFDLVPKAA